MDSNVSLEPGKTESQQYVTVAAAVPFWGWRFFVWRGSGEREGKIIRLYTRDGGGDGCADARGGMIWACPGREGRVIPAWRVEEHGKKEAGDERRKLPY